MSTTPWSSPVRLDHPVRFVADEAGIIGLADHLPTGPSYAAVRAPIGEGGGFAWFANRGIGRPVAESLTETMAWFRGWLDEVAPSGRPVVLVGVPVYVAHGDADTVIPRELLDRPWTYLLGESGASTSARRDPGGHGITATTVAELGGWIAARQPSAEPAR